MPAENQIGGTMNGGRAMAEMLRLHGAGPMFGMHAGPCVLGRSLPGITASVDQQSVWDYLAYRYVPAPGTLSVPAPRFFFRM